MQDVWPKGVRWEFVIVAQARQKSKTCSCSLNQDKWSFRSCFVLDETLMLSEVSFLNYYLNSRVFEWQLRISPWKHVPT